MPNYTLIIAFLITKLFCLWFAGVSEFLKLCQAFHLFFAWNYFFYPICEKIKSKFPFERSLIVSKQKLFLDSSPSGLTCTFSSLVCHPINTHQFCFVTSVEKCDWVISPILCYYLTHHTYVIETKCCWIWRLASVTSHKELL